MDIIKGIAASPGVAIGPALLHKPALLEIKHDKLPPEAAEGELARLKTAYEKSRADLEELEKQLKETIGPDYARVIDAHKTMMEDPHFKSLIKNKIQKDRLPAESAVLLAAQEISVSFDSLSDEFFKERKNDVTDVAKRLINNLAGGARYNLEIASAPSVLVAHNLLPSDTLNLKVNNFIAFVTDIGGKTSHSALLAQSLEIPAVVGSSTSSKAIKNGDTVIVDGESGAVIVNPDAETLAKYKKIQKEIKRTEVLLKTINDLPFLTTDGKHVRMMINYDPRLDSKESKKLKTEGVGLVRTEFLFLDRAVPPSENEQFDIYLATAKKFDMRPVHIRLADLGGDKVHTLNLGEYKDELNPFMGLRGVRILLKYPTLLQTQLRAIIRAAAETPAQIKIIVPMVSCIEEVLAVKQVFNETLAALHAQGIVPKNKIDYGIMVEVPSAAFALDSMLGEIDFISIGTNDLIQYMIAVDRMNQDVAALYDPYHPGFIRMLSHIIQTCARRNKSAAVCGEIASDPAIAPLLIGLGVNALSTSPRMFLRIKNRLRSVSYEACVNLAKASLLANNSQDIKKLSAALLEPGITE